MTRSLSESLSKKSTELIQKSRNLLPNPKLIRQKAEAVPLDDAKNILSGIVMKNFQETRNQMKTLHEPANLSKNSENLEQVAEEESLEGSMRELWEIWESIKKLFF